MCGVAVWKRARVWEGSEGTRGPTRFEAEEVHDGIHMSDGLQAHCDEEPDQEHAAGGARAGQCGQTATRMGAARASHEVEQLRLLPRDLSGA